MNNLSKVFSTISATVIILLSLGNLAIAQETVDKMPMPKAGMSALAKNIVYPESARKEGIEGKVFIVATVDADGKVINTEIKKSVNSELDAAAVKAVEMTAFTPAEKNGKKVKATVTIPIQFKLDNCKEDKNGTEKKS